MTHDYIDRDHAVWENVYAELTPEWFEKPPSEAMRLGAAYFASQPCRRLLDVGCGFGRWVQAVAGVGGAGEVVGVDYSGAGARTAGAWARREGLQARFLVASAMALPFVGRPFDGVLASRLLDNLSRPDCLAAMGAVNAVTRPGARGLFVFNPVFSSEELARIPADVRDCMHVVYADDEFPACLPGWSIDRLRHTSDRFRVIEASFRG